MHTWKGIMEGRKEGDINIEKITFTYIYTCIHSTFIYYTGIYELSIYLYIYIVEKEKGKGGTEGEGEGKGRKGEKGMRMGKAMGKGERGE